MLDRKLTAVLALVALAVLASGCGDSDDDGEADASAPSGVELADEWDAEAAAAYEAAGKDREREWAQGALVEGCFFLDQEGANAVAAALGEDVEAEVSDKNFLHGPPGEEEQMICGLSDPADTESGEGGLGSVGAGTTLATPEQYTERLLREPESTELEGTAEGLDAAEVVAVEREGINTFVWVNEDFTIGVSAPAELITVDEGFAALPVVVDEVSRTLLG
jgi:hypothetical protein